MKKSKLIIIVVIALIVGVVNYLVYPMVVDLTIKTIQVPVIRRTLKQNEALLSEDITYIAMPEGYLPSDVILDPNEYIGKYIKPGYTLSSNSFLYDSYFYQKEFSDKQLLINLQVDTPFSKTSLLTDYCNLYFSGEMKIEDVKYVVNGMLAENVKIKEVKENSIVLVVNEELFDYIIKGQSLGKVIPTNVVIESSSDYYSTNKLKAIIDEYCVSTKGASSYVED